MSKNRITLELRNSKSSLVGPQAAEQVFTALPDLHNRLWPITRSQPVSFELYCTDQMVTFSVNLPLNLDQYIKSQITAAYPEVVISSPDKSLANFHAIWKKPAAVGRLTLNHGSFYPLKSYRDFQDTDPIATILGFFSKLQPQQSALVQILVTSTSDSWKRRGYRLAEGTTSSDGSHTPHPFKPQIEAKLSEICYKTVINIATSSSNISTSNSLLKSLAESFRSIQSPEGNKLVLKKPLPFFKNKLLYSMPYREFPRFGGQYFSAKELATIFHLPYAEIKTIKNIAWGKTLLGEPPENLPTFNNTPEDQRDSVNLFASTEFKNEQQVFGIRDIDRRRHIYAIGKSGTGKSTLLANMIINDLKHNKGLAVIDPHGDLAEIVLNYIPSHRINDVVYLNPADMDYSVRMNLLEDKDTQHKELIASGIIAIFKKLYGHSWGPRLEYILRNSLLTLVEKDQSTMEDIVKILTNKKFRERTVEKISDPILKNFWVNEFENMGDKLQAEAVSPILNKIGQFVTSPMIRSVINHPTSSFSLKEVMDEGKILIANLSQGKLGEDNAALLGAMLITKIQLTAMNRVYQAEEDRRDFYLYVDEFQNFATTSFIKILSEARKYRLNLCLANQYIDQVEEDVRKAIFGNAATLITFLVGAQDASLLSQEFGEQYMPEDLVGIGQYQVVMKLSVDGRTSVPFPAWTLGLASSSNQNKEKVIQVSQERYAKKRMTQPQTPTKLVSSNQITPKNDQSSTSVGNPSATPNHKPTQT